MNSNIRTEIKDYIMILVGTAIYCAGVAFFMLPYQLATGGVTGIAAIIFYATGIEVQVSYSLINLIFLCVAVKVLGWKFCMKTIYGVSSCTFWMWLWQRLAEDENGVLPQICGDQTFMACVLGAMIVGAGLSICFTNHGSTGGTDIIAAIVNKYKDISLGQMILACDVIIISSCYFVFHDVERVIFGYVMMGVCSLSLDYCLQRIHQVVEIKVYSRNYAGVADAINTAGFGVTVMDGEGWWTKSERKVVVCVASRRYYPMIAREIQRVDPYSFVSVSAMLGVYGEGFSTMKTKLKNQKPVVVFATNNANKLREARAILGDRYEVRSLKEVGCHDELPETHATIEENAMEKARYVHKYYGFDCFADDTGLEVEALNGAPGTYSARYANLDDPDYDDPLLDVTKDHDTEANIRKLLYKLRETHNRKAQFRTSIALISKGEEHQFEGVVRGGITREKLGTHGFGYDPVFIPEGYDQSFAELPDDVKNRISHRAIAVEKLAEFLKG